MKEPHPTDHRSFCSRCRSSYRTVEGCPCWEHSDSDLERARDIQLEQAIQRHLDSLEPSDEEVDKEQSRWEAWRTKENF